FLTNNNFIRKRKKEMIEFFSGKKFIFKKRKTRKKEAVHVACLFGTAGARPCAANLVFLTPGAPVPVEIKDIITCDKKGLPCLMS
ncbi:hypothetical protein ACJX0J_013802, partial [Zea mays]